MASLSDNGQTQFWTKSTSKLIASNKRVDSKLLNIFRFKKNSVRDVPVVISDEEKLPDAKELTILARREPLLFNDDHDAMAADVDQTQIQTQTQNKRRRIEIAPP